MTDLAWFEVASIDPVLGVGKQLERIKASSREAAEETARARHGKHILVTIAGGRARPRRDDPRRHR